MHAHSNTPATPGDVSDKLLTEIELPRSTAARREVQAADKNTLRHLMARDIAELSKINPEGSVTRTDLVRLGWPHDVVEAHGLAASAMVNEILNERRPGPDPSMIPALAEDMLNKAASIATRREHLQCALSQKGNDCFSTTQRIDQHITALRREAKAMAALGDAVAHTIARLQAREPLRGLR